MYKEKLWPYVLTFVITYLVVESVCITYLPSISGTIFGSLVLPGVFGIMVCLIVYFESNGK